MILHHYPASPFAEKIRAILGFKQLNWQSVMIPSVMPKPDLMPLTGGYRKTPVLQIGADVYCDTALICDVLEHLAPSPSLYKRQAMRGGGARMHFADGTAMYKSHVRRIASMLEGQAFLLGDQPCLADFSVYHSLWFTRVQVPVLASIFDTTPVVQTSLDRMAAFGHGQMTPITAEAALQTAKGSTPQPLADQHFQDEHGIALGSQVTVAAESFGTEPTAGELVAATRTRYTLRRQDDRVGAVHVHFPRMGFVMKKVDA